MSIRNHIRAWAVTGLFLCACGGGTEGTGVISTETGIQTGGASGDVPQEMGGICGVVTDTQNRPVVNLLIESPLTGDSTATGADGAFVLLLPSPSAATVSLLLGDAGDQNSGEDSAANLLSEVTVPTGEGEAVYQLSNRTITLRSCLTNTASDRENG